MDTLQIPFTEYQRKLFPVLYQLILLIKGFPLRESWQPQAD